MNEDSQSRLQESLAEETARYYEAIRRLLERPGAPASGTARKEEEKMEEATAS